MQQLFIVAKAPQFGQVKTRLARDIGKVHALRHYRAMTGRVLKQVQDTRWQCCIAITPPRQIGHVPAFNGWRQVPQSQGNLSLRLADIFSHKGTIMVIGTDCPDICTQDIALGFKALRHHKAVFGPAADGGFWLMAMHGPVRPAVFTNIRWSHADTLAHISARVDGKICYLRTLYDIDNLTALKAVRGGREA